MAASSLPDRDPFSTPVRSRVISWASSRTPSASESPPLAPWDRWPTIQLGIRTYLPSSSCSPSADYQDRSPTIRLQVNPPISSGPPTRDLTLSALDDYPT